MSIPALIVPVLTGPELLARMLMSIDHPVDQVVIIDNGGVTHPWLDEDDGVTVVSLPHNLGVAASWNLGIKVTPFAPWWLIVNHDIEFGPGDLARLEATVEPRAGILYTVLGMAVFAITPPVIQTVGLFDEALVLAYNEDLDYVRRCDLAGIIRQDGGFSGSHVGSATIGSDNGLRAHNHRSHTANDAYYAKKWGGLKQGGETFETPFDRNAGQGEWQFDLERYRAQTWPRPK